VSLSLSGWPTFSVAAGILHVGLRSPTSSPTTEISLEFFFLGLSSMGALFLYLWCSSCVVMDIGFLGLMIESGCVEGKTFEVSRGGGVSPFRITEFSRRRRFFVTLSLEEFRWLAVVLVRFGSSKGDSFWVTTCRWNQRCWLLKLKSNSQWRFIMLSHFVNLGQSRTIVLPEGPKADGCFGVANLFKEVLIEANKALSMKQQVTPHTCTPKVSNHLSFADALRGRVEKSKSSELKGWRC